MQIGWMSQACEPCRSLTSTNRRGMKGSRRSSVLPTTTRPDVSPQSFAHRGVVWEWRCRCGLSRTHRKGIRLIDRPGASRRIGIGLPDAAPATLFNTAATDDAARRGCIPTFCTYCPAGRCSRTLVQYLVAKRWQNLLLVVGDGEAIAIASNIHHAAQSSGAYHQEKPWTFVPGARRTDTGHLIQPRVPGAPGASATTFWSLPTKRTGSAMNSLTAPSIRARWPGPGAFPSAGRDPRAMGRPNCRTDFCATRSGG